MSDTDPEKIAATPAVGGEMLPAFEDTQVQIVYEVVCETDENVPPNPEEHWEGWMARRIVAALRATAPQALAATPAVGGHMHRSELDDASNACLELCAKHGFATGHGDTVADMIREIDGQIATPAVGGEAELREQLHYLTGTCELAMKHRDIAEHALEVALADNPTGPIDSCRWIALLDRAEDAEAKLATQPASPLWGREDIAALLYMTRFPHLTWISAGPTETAFAYKQADAILTARPPSPLRGREPELLRLIAWCRPRLSRDVYRTSLDDQLANPRKSDDSKVVQS